MTEPLDPLWARLFAGGESRRPAYLPGLRWGRITKNPEGQLVLSGIGAGQRYLWRPGWNFATCKEAHRPAGPRCTCGLHACIDLVELVRTVHSEAGLVLCAVEGAGRVQVHERGWRAGAARLLAMTPEAPTRVVLGADGTRLTVWRRRHVDPDELAAVANYYRVPVVRLLDLEEASPRQGGD